MQLYACYFAAFCFFNILLILKQYKTALRNNFISLIFVIFYLVELLC